MGHLETHSPSKVPTLPLKSKGIGKGVQRQAQSLLTILWQTAGPDQGSSFIFTPCISLSTPTMPKYLNTELPQDAENPWTSVCMCVSAYVHPYSYQEHLKLRLRINNSGQLTPQGKNLSPKADYSRLDFCSFGFFRKKKVQCHLRIIKKKSTVKAIFG